MNKRQKLDKIKIFENPSLIKRSLKLNEYRKLEKFTDLTLKLTDGKIMKVHKMILSEACPYFEEKLNSSTCSPADVIPLGDIVTMTDLEILVQYFYTGQLEVSLENAINLLIKSNYFKLMEVEKFCSEILIENIQIDNCLDYWRISIRCSIKILNAACHEFIETNCKDFLANNVMNLTAREFKLIMAANKLLIDPEDLYKYVAKWTKEDFKARNLYIMDLIRYVNFTKISAKFIQTEIISDEILKTNHKFLGYIQNIMIKKLCGIINNQLNENSLKNIYLITNGGIYKLNIKKSMWTIKQSFPKDICKEFAATMFYNEILISGGCTGTYDWTNIYSFNLTWNTINQNLPKMLLGRSLHKLINFNSKLYCCGGIRNMGSMEVFDIENLKWTQGPSMNEHKFSFGLVTSKKSLYAFGGHRSNVVEQFDPREGKWIKISTDTPTSSQAVILSNNLVYCFDNISGGNIFDLRTTKWTDSLPTAFVKKEGLQYFSKCYDIIEFNGEIFAVFQTDNSQTWGTFKLNPRTNEWVNLNIPLNLNEFSDIRLCSF